MVDERDKARARLGLPPLTSASVATPTSKVASAVNTNTIDGITAASNAAPATAPVVDTRIALRKLQSGEALTDDEKRSLGLPVAVAATASTDSKPKWVKASTVNTAKGPVDVDANGLAEDGSTPVILKAPGGGDLGAGFTAGPFPKELEQFFGSSAGIIGYRIITNEDGSQQLEVSDTPGSSKTFGFKFGKDNTGKFVPFKSSGSGVGGDVSGKGLKTPEQIAADEAAAEKKAKRKSAYDLLYEEFDRYGLGSLVAGIKDLIESDTPPSEFTLKLRQTPAYLKRFSANAKRIANGFKAVDEATYLGLEDKYQEIMMNYGLPSSYYAQSVDPVTGIKTQAGFEELIAGNVDPVTLEERLIYGKKKVLDSNPEVYRALKQFYPDITDGDILAYVVNPKNALDDIKRKVTTAEIGGAAIQAGLNLGNTPEERAAYAARAKELEAAGITKAQAAAGYTEIAQFAPRGSQLSEIYKQSPYTQTTAEAELFGLAGKTEAQKERKKLTELETAAFSGRAGAGAISRDRAGTL